MHSVVNDESKEDTEFIQLQSKSNKWIEYTLLELIMLSPIAFVVIFFWHFQQPLTALLLFQILTLFIFPYIYAHKYYEQGYLNMYKVTNKRNQFLIGFCLLLATFIGTATYKFINQRLCYCVCEFSNFIDFDRLDGVKDAYLIPTAIFLGTTNPFLEELFWRVFVPYQFTLNEMNIWYLSFHYALYHFFVVYQFTKYSIQISSYIWVAFAGLLIVCVAGRVLFFINKKIGLLAASLCHMGADLGIIAICAYYKYF